MFKRFGGSSSTLWKSKNPHSVEYLRYLHGVLMKNEKVTENNKTLLVEAIRAIAEILIWGDQNDGSVFDFFLERQMFSHFISIMKQKSGSYVNVQLLQTLNILFENIRHETSLYFLLSNNHVNSIILHNFDFNNEEVIAYYISFLKTLSFKLNTYTIHFFFNEGSDEFPLYTEAIRFFNHSESMVRIAVRTLTLNIFRVKDEAMSKFVRERSEAYFDEVARHIAKQVISMDTFATFAHNEQSNRDRLLNMIDAHLDNMHYINDIFMVECAKLNPLLMRALFKYLFGPLYLSSLAGVRNGPTVILSKVTSLFLLSQFVMVIHDTEVVRFLLSTFFFGDENNVSTEWVRGMETGLQFRFRTPVKQPRERIFFNSHLNALGGLHDDHACFYALMLFYCITQNKGAISETLDAAQIPCAEKSKKCDARLTDAFLKIVEDCGRRETNIRPITVELCCVLLRKMLLALESDDESFHITVEDTVRKALDSLTVLLREFVFSENLFLEMFESEYYQIHWNELKMSTISEDPGLYLPPSNTPLSGIPLSQRLPCGSDERIRRTLQFYFILRKFHHDLIGEVDSQLPLAQKMRPMAEVNDCINLNNSDLLSCTVVREKGDKISRFLVTDQFQLILVEPDNRKLGWAIVRFVGLLQDTQTTGDSSDSRTLHVVVEDVKSRAIPNSRKGHVHTRQPLLSAKFIFDDHIRCMAAKQRLSKGRKNARHFKLTLICELLGIRPTSSLSLSPAGQRHTRLYSGSVYTLSSPSSLIAGGTSQFYVPLPTTSGSEVVPNSTLSNVKSGPSSLPFRGPGFVQKLSGAGADHLRMLGALHSSNRHDNNNSDSRKNSIGKEDEGSTTATSVEDGRRSSASQIPDDPIVQKSPSPPNTSSPTKIPGFSPVRQI